MKRIPLWTLLYIALVTLVNVTFPFAPVLHLSDGGLWAPMGIFTGLVLVVRDFSQREIDGLVVVPLTIGIVLSYFFAPPEIAMASGIAFAMSEIVDWTIYSFSTRSFAGRVMASSLFAAPIDTIIFLLIANMALPGYFHFSTMLSSIATKLVVAYIAYRLIRRGELKAPQLIV